VKSVAPALVAIASWPSPYSRAWRGADLTSAAVGLPKAMAYAAVAGLPLRVLDCSAIVDIEYTALKMLIDGQRRLREHGVELWPAALNRDAMGVVERAELPHAGPRTHVLQRRGRRPASRDVPICLAIP
jgi:hypothetical protein